MKILFVTMMMLAGAAGAQATVGASPSETMKDTALRYLQPVLDRDWKDAKITDRCGVAKIGNQKHKYSCVFQVETPTAMGAYAVMFDRDMNFAAIVRGEGKKVGKDHRYSFTVKDNLGYNEIKPAVNNAKEVP